MLVFAHQLNEKDRIAMEGYAANHVGTQLSLNCEPCALIERLEQHPHSSKLAWLLFDMTRMDPTMRPHKRRAA